MNVALNSKNATAARRFRFRIGEDQVTAYLFLFPALILFALFAWYPIASSVILSFQNVGLHELHQGGAEWIGLRNYERMVADPVFKAAWRNSFEFAGLSVMIGFFIPILVAILVNEMRLAKGFFRLVYFLPNVIPGVIALLVWQQIYRVPNGFLNTLLMELGFHFQRWIQDPAQVKPSMIAVMTWGGFGSTMLLYLAALQDVPTELYEAAEIDGASPVDRIRSITLPHLKPTMLTLLILQIIGVAQVFMEPFVLKNYPGQSATTPVLTLYRKAFLNSEFGLASAWSVLLIVLLAAFSAIYLRISRVIESEA
ncbi:MAG TPA: sugar ABC transporter permease [Aggregatilinea sp.]|uniref:carbohydrate ABC transporter permease n=1 Tax=Aggregatilinea sp. TaxID=2806333 RepID=UPI002B5CAB13|nr:sugar ABC transporter permease [Aggregatilinea sp.]HML21415.1 sugar ABC transporter permease [Aggregatilinea sp.]